MTKAETVEALLAKHGRTFYDELGINLSRSTPSPLFQWLMAAILFSARIRWTQTIRSARALSDAGWRTADRMAAATWEQRVKVLNRNGYARYGERTSRMFQGAAVHLRERHRGDLRNLREETGRDPEAERRLLKQVKGRGDVAVDIFFREIQQVWDELRPFADRLALKAASRLHLGSDAKALIRRVDDKDYVRLIAALARAELENKGEEDLRDDKEG